MLSECKVSKKIRIFLFKEPFYFLEKVKAERIDFSAFLASKKKAYICKNEPCGSLLLKHVCMTVIHRIIIVIALLSLALPADAQSYHGEATYYSNRFHGRRTSSGERYHKDSMTCAHRTLPFGTLLRVRNKKNGKEVIVEVTDRGPFRKGTIVDLSLAAAKELDMIHAGVAKVEVTHVDPSEIKLQPMELPVLVEYKPFLPEMKVYDESSGKSYLLSEWKKLVPSNVKMLLMQQQGQKKAQQKEKKKKQTERRAKDKKNKARGK